MINQPRHTYIHNYHPHTTTWSHRNNKPKSGSPNQRGQSNIASWDTRRDNYGSESKIKDRCNSSGSDDNGHYHEGRFCRSHSSRKRLHRWYHDIRQPNDMHDAETVEAVRSVGKSKPTPSAPHAWQIMKQWICYSLSALATLCWCRLRGSQGLDAKKTLRPGLALANIIDSCIGGTPLYKGIRRGGIENQSNDVLCCLRHQSQVKHEACGKPLRGI